MQALRDNFPSFLVPVIGFCAVALIGYADYLTGDYSILIFYLLPVSFVCWYHSRLGGFAVAVASGIARFLSDASLYQDASVHVWNSLQDMAFLLVAGFLVSFLRVELQREKGR